VTAGKCVGDGSACLVQILPERRVASEAGRSLPSRASEGNRRFPACAAGAGAPFGKGLRITGRPEADFAFYIFGKPILDSTKCEFWERNEG
jgi:hypothetical protein